MIIVPIDQMSSFNKNISKVMAALAILFLPLSVHAAGDNTGSIKPVDQNISRVNYESRNQAENTDTIDSEDSGSDEYSDDELASESHSDDSEYEYTGYGSTSFGFRPQ